MSGVNFGSFIIPINNNSVVKFDNLIEKIYAVPKKVVEKNDNIQIRLCEKLEKIEVIVGSAKWSDMIWLKPKNWWVVAKTHRTSSWVMQG